MRITIAVALFPSAGATASLAEPPAAVYAVLLLVLGLAATVMLAVRRRVRLASA